MPDSLVRPSAEYPLPLSPRLRPSTLLANALWAVVASALIACQFEAAELPMVAAKAEAEAGKSGADASGAHTAASAGTSSRAGGEGGAKGDDAPGSGGQSSPEGGSESGAAGGLGSDGGDAGAGGTGDDVSECDITTGCTASCQEESSTCTVAPLDFACEFSAVTGQSAQVACGEMVAIGMACCGGCGCVDVKVYFDGHKCWQGIPDCQIELFTDKLFSPPQ